SDTTYASAQTVLLATAASDNSGVTSVQFYDGSVLVQTDTTRPFTYSWSFTSADNGTSHTFTAKALDAAGNSTTSLPRVLSIDIGAGTGSAPAPGPTSAIIFQDGFESGDFSQWSFQSDA